MSTKPQTSHCLPCQIYQSFNSEKTDFSMPVNANFKVSVNQKRLTLQFCKTTEDGLYSMPLQWFSFLFFSKASSTCCNKATLSCGVVCRGIYVTGGGSTRVIRHVLAQHCSPANRKVEQCIHKQWHPQSGTSENCKSSPFTGKVNVFFFSYNKCIHNFMSRAVGEQVSQW